MVVLWNWVSILIHSVCIMKMGQISRSNKLGRKDFKDKISNTPISQTEGLLKKPSSKVWVPQVSLGEAYEIWSQTCAQGTFYPCNLFWAYLISYKKFTKMKQLWILKVELVNVRHKKFQGLNHNLKIRKILWSFGFLTRVWILTFDIYEISWLKWTSNDS